MRFSNVVVVAVAALCVSSSGCKKEEVVEYPTVTSPPPTTPPPPPVGTIATPIAAAQTPFLTTLITASVTLDTRGMQPEGNPWAGRFTQGQIMEQPLQVEPGRCYTILAASGPGVSELDVKIVFQPVPMTPPAVLAQDNQSGPVAILGGGGNCWKNPTPLSGPAKVVLTVVSGNGEAAAQIYKK